MKSFNYFSKALALVVIVSAFFVNEVYPQSWNALGSGANEKVYAAIVFNGELVIAGEFITAGGVTVNHIARWNGTAWQGFGTGMDSTVNALEIFNNQLIAAGKFTTAGGVACNRIARWTGSAWQAMGLGMNGEIHCLLNYNTQLRAGGKFTTAGGITVNRIARWDGTNWLAFPGGTIGANDDVLAFALIGQDMILGGKFTQVAGVTRNRIVRYNGNPGTWFNLAQGIDNGAVFALTSVGTTLYVGGSFTTIGGSNVNRIASWNGTNWNLVSSGTNGDVLKLFTSGTSVVVGGAFTTAGPVSANNIAVWSGSAFTALGAGLTGGSNPEVNAITIWSNILIAGGKFTTAGVLDVSANNVAGYGSLPLAPTLVSPTNASTGQSLTPLLNWNDVTGASTYGVQLSTNPNFNTTIINVNGLTTSQYQVATPLNNNTTYFWRARAANGLGNGPFSSIWFFTTLLVGVINNQEIPLTYNLYQNYPNPFNPVTKIKFDLPANNNSNATIKLEVFDASGKVAASLLNHSYAAGKWEVDFNASILPSGVYFYRLTAGDFVDTKSMILIK